MKIYTKVGEVVNKLIESFGHLASDLSLDESSFYFINDTYLIVFRKNDFSEVEKVKIDDWANSHKNMFDQYQIEEKRITFKNLRK